MPGIKTIKWYSGGAPYRPTLDAIMAARQQLVNEGLERPTVRETLYKLLPNGMGFTKEPHGGHYDTLCSFLEDCKERGLIPWGLFSPDGAGDDRTPMTSREIAERIAALRDAMPAHLSKDGYLYGVLVEHAGMTGQVAGILDYEVGVVSSQGQIRGEHLHEVLETWADTAKELGAKEIRMVALVDYDKWGKVIFEAHERWLRAQFGIRLKLFGPTFEQIRAAHLATNEDHQLDGWIAAYGVQRFRRELRRAVGLPP